MFWSPSDTPHTRTIINAIDNTHTLPTYVAEVGDEGSHFVPGTATRTADLSVNVLRVTEQPVTAWPGLFVKARVNQTVKLSLPLP